MVRFVRDQVVTARRREPWHDEGRWTSSLVQEQGKRDERTLTSFVFVLGEEPWSQTAREQREHHCCVRSGDFGMFARPINAIRQRYGNSWPGADGSRDERQQGKQQLRVSSLPSALPETFLLGLRTFCSIPKGYRPSHLIPITLVCSLPFCHPTKFQGSLLLAELGV